MDIKSFDFEHRVSEVIPVLYENKLYGTISLVRDLKKVVDEMKEIRNKAIDEAIETSAKAICIGCGYLDGYKCNYKGCNCGVSKPMLESVVKALEQMKGSV